MKCHCNSTTVTSVKASLEWNINLVYLWTFQVCVRVAQNSLLPELYVVCTMFVLSVLEAPNTKTKFLVCATHLAIKLFLILILILNVTAGAIPGMWASSLRIWAQRALFKEMSGPLCYLNPLLIHWSLFSYSVEIFISVPGGERAEIPLRRLYIAQK